MTAKRKSKGAYMISAVAEMYEIHPQTLRLYEREGLLKPSRTEGNRDHSADARADGRDEPADAELCGVRAHGDAGAVPAECARDGRGDCADSPDNCGDEGSFGPQTVVVSPASSPDSP